MKNLHGLSRIFTLIAVLACSLQTRAQVTALTGVISDCSNSHLITGAKLSADSGVCFSVQGGVFYIRVAHGGTYSITIQKQGYADTLIPGVLIQQGSLTTRNFCLNVKGSAPSQPFVAAVNSSQSRVDLNWGNPSGNYEQLDDDGIQDTSLVSNDPGRMYAVKFTVSSSPVSIVGGSADIGESSSYPAGITPAELSPITMQVYDATGTGGSPGNPIGHSVTIKPSAFGWNFFAIEGVSLGSGDFYLVMEQTGNPPYACHMAVDTSGNHLKSWQKESSGSWVLANGNFMLRSVINGPGGPPEHPLTLLDYKLYRFLVQDRSNSSSWVQTGTTSLTIGSDNSWPTLPDSCFMWAVKAEYSGGVTSAAILSNWLGKNRSVNVTVYVYPSCYSSPLAGSHVVLTSLPPCEGLFSYSGYTGAGFKVNFTGVQKAGYYIQVTRPGYHSDTSFQSVYADYSYDSELLRYMLPPANSMIDNRSLRLTWSPPQQTLTILCENFSKGFAINGWSNPNGYWSTVSQSGNPAPDAEFSWLTSAVNYSAPLISPVLYGDGSPVFYLKYDLNLQDYAFSGTEQMDVEIQVSGNGSFTSLRHYANNGNIAWLTDSINLGLYSKDTFSIRFHAHGIDAYRITSWHIDNVKVISSGPVPGSCINGYFIYLNGELQGATADTSCTVPGSFFPYGSTDTACVMARYSLGASEKVCTPAIVSGWLCPPTHLRVSKTGYSAILSWVKPTEGEKMKGAASDSAHPRSFSGVSLLGYNIRRNGTPVAYIGDPDSLHYYDKDLDPGTYQYSVTAYYDVSPLPPLRDNSIPSDTASITINGSSSWPFYEPWDRRIFDFNGWKHTGSWMVSLSEGNPAPCAELPGQPLRTGYSDTLESVSIDAGDYTCAKVYLDYDIRLLSIRYTGAEFLSIELYLGGKWKTIREYTNASDVLWTRGHLELQAAAGRSFQLRFLAHGANSGDIQSWDLDNISVYAVCNPADSLTCEYVPNQVSLSWKAPDCKTAGPSSGWLCYDTGNNGNGLGWLCQEIFDLAAHWTPAQIAAFDGGAVTSIKFFASEPGTAMFRARIWQGAAGTDLVFDQAVPFVHYGQWNTVNLEEPLFIDGSKDLWIGLNVYFIWGWPMGLDNGPTIDGYGNMIYYNGTWVSLNSQFYCPDNFNIEAYVETARDAVKPVTVQPVNVSGGCGKSTLSLQKKPGGRDEGKYSPEAAEATGALIAGYNVWRTDSTGNLSTFHRINDSPVPAIGYTDILTTYPGVYKYYVTTVMNSGLTNNFLCESPGSDTVSVSQTGIKEKGIPGISIYPNPASDQVIVSSDFMILSVEVIDHTGQTTYTDNRVNSRSLLISVANLQVGMYFIKASTLRGTVVGKITVAH